MQSVAFVIDDDTSVSESICNLLNSVDIPVQPFRTVDEFLDLDRPDIAGCIILDVRLPGRGGLEFQVEAKSLGISLPIIFLTAYADVPMSVRAMKNGAFEFLCKPFRAEDLIDAVRAAIRKDQEQRSQSSSLAALRERYETLTAREREILSYVVSGLMNKQIAAKLNLSEITIKVHRANVKIKMQARSLAELVRQADSLAATRSPQERKTANPMRFSHRARSSRSDLDTNANT